MWIAIEELKSNAIREMRDCMMCIATGDERERKFALKHYGAACALEDMLTEAGVYLTEDERYESMYNRAAGILFSKEV